ncbi:MAG: type II toxin-antitoxin system VapC family toxin [Acidobacteriota bacterium]
MRAVFADTSALYALFDRDDEFHRRAEQCFSEFAPDSTVLISSSYVLLETLALLQSRLGMHPIKKWKSEFEPILEIVWVDADLHRGALSASIAANKRPISLADWVSFEIMRERGIEDAFSFDPDFSRQGFNLLP